jgi:hypothetical protein
MYFADPAVALRHLTRFVKPAGLVLFHELDMTAAKSEPVCELFRQTVDRMTQTFSRAGADIRMGLKLARVFQEAGLPRPEMIQGARVESGPDSPAYTVVAQLARTLLPLMERTGVATAAEMDIDTLAGRLREETMANQATWVSPAFIGPGLEKSLRRNPTRTWPGLPLTCAS